jgi:large repetitive protein
VTKTGDATAYHPVLGATFELHAETPAGPRLAGPLAVTDATGTVTFTDVVTTDVDTVWLVETMAPAGYALADPIAVATSGAADVTVEDHAVPGTVTLVKTDATTGEPVPGAVLRVRYDADNDGSFETDLGAVTSAPLPVTISDLRPGRYQVTEQSPPPGYLLPDEPVQTVVLAPGGALTVTFADVALTTVGFAKVATGSYDPDSYTLAGAVFAVYDEAGTEVGRCTTGTDGRCALAGAPLRTGARYCWAELVAPPGFAAADGGCFTAVHPSAAASPPYIPRRSRRSPLPSVASTSPSR